MINNYRVNFGGDTIDYRDNFGDCKQYFPILEKFYDLMASYEIDDAWHFFEPYVELTWVCEYDTPGDTVVGEEVLNAVLQLLADEGIEPTLVHRPKDGVVVDWYCKSPEEQEFGYKTYALSAKTAMLFWKYRDSIAKGCGEKGQYMRRPHALANQLALNYELEAEYLGQRAVLCQLFWTLGHEEAVRVYEKLFEEKYL